MSSPVTGSPEPPDTGTSSPPGRGDQVLPGQDLAQLTDQLAAAVQAVPGVAGLHGGMFGEAATYLPGRRVAGIRRTDAGTEIHVSLLYGYPVRETANTVRAAVAAVAPGPVHVTVEDVVPATKPDQDRS